MKRLIASALILGVSTIGLVGCEEKSEVKTVKEVNTPGGTEKVTDKTTIEKTGDAKTNAPANADAPK